MKLNFPVILLGSSMSLMGTIAIFTGQIERGNPEFAGQGIYGYPARVLGTALLACGLWALFNAFKKTR